MLMAHSNPRLFQATQEAQPPRRSRDELRYGCRLGLVAAPEAWQRPPRGCGFNLLKMDRAAVLLQIQQADDLNLIAGNLSQCRARSSQLEPVSEIAQAAIRKRRRPVLLDRAGVPEKLFEHGRTLLSERK